MNSLMGVSNERLSPKEIRELRQTLGMTQDQVGKELNLPTQTIASWEQTQKDNKTPRRSISQENQIKLLALYNFYLDLEWEQTEVSG